MGAGTMRDYEALAGFHYRRGRPAGVVRVWTARYRGEGMRRKDSQEMRAAGGAVAGVLVEARPVLNCALRGMALGGRYAGAEKDLLAVLLNEEVRTIARVVVAPQFRGIGVGTELVRQALAHAQTRYVEALAVMGRVAPFFEKAGMRRYERPPGPEVVRLLAAVEADWYQEVVKRRRAGEAGRGDIEGGNGTWAAARLIGLRGQEVSGFLAGELRRFVRRTEGGVEQWLREARRRVGASPVYYLWERGDKMTGGYGRRKVL